MKGFTVIESDYDCVISQRVFTGTLTEARYKKISRSIRRLNHDFGHCGHDWDCCGCLCSQDAKLSFGNNTTTITLVQGFNY